MQDMVKTKKKEEKTKKKIVKMRPPVVAVLGHVDHGKSSLLEAIRDDFVITEKESGGITQHIGAYEVDVNGKKITFVDTPGHEAFSAMRQRGANVADIAILVVDASEGVKDQTKEAIKFIKQAHIPMLVVFNKMDKPGALPEKVKSQLAKVDVTVETYGGKVPSVNVSAKEKTGIDELLETILLVAELEGFKSDTKSSAKGTVIESSLHPKKGPIATLIIRKGILHEGDILTAGSIMGKMKNLSDFQGNTMKQAMPSQPVSVLGFSVPPAVGETFKVYESKQEAEEAIEDYESKLHKEDKVAKPKSDAKILKIIVKADVLGSVEAIDGILKAIPQEKIILQVLKLEVGDITSSDVQLASHGDAKIFGFRVRVDENTKFFAQQKDIDIKVVDVIYELVQTVRETMLSVLAPETKRTDIGKFEITHIFKQTKAKQVIGGKVKDGEITLNTRVEVQRDEEIIGTGRVKTLQKDKQDIGKATKGQQVAMSFNSETKVEEGDLLIIFREERSKGTL